MKTIEITARFEVRYTKQLTDDQVVALEGGTDVEDLVDESEAYRLAATEGECEMDWDYAQPKAKKKGRKSA